MAFLSGPDTPGDTEKAPTPTLGSALREARQQAGRSLRAIEREIGMNSGYLSQIENDHVAQPHPAQLVKLANGYGIHYRRLLVLAGYSDGDPVGYDQGYQDGYYAALENVRQHVEGALSA